MLAKAGRVLTIEDLKKIRGVEQNTQEWLDLRNGIVRKHGVVTEWLGNTIGASASAAHVGWSPYVDTPLLFRRDIGYIPPPVMGAPKGKFCPLRHGHELEDATLVAYALALSTIPVGGEAAYRKIRQRLARAGWGTPGGRQPLPYPQPPNCKVWIKPTGIYFNPEFPVGHGSVDALVALLTKEGVVYSTSGEAKSPVYKNYESIPIPYLIQMMHQKLCVALSFMDEFTHLFPRMREELKDTPDLLDAFNAFAETLEDGKDKRFAQILFDGYNKAMEEGREFTMSDVLSVDATIEFMACWWANEGRDRHVYRDCESVCGHLRVWRIKYNHAFALLIKHMLSEYADAVNEDIPSLDDPRICRELKSRFGGDDSAYIFEIARVCEAYIYSPKLGEERNGKKRPPSRFDVSFPFVKHFEEQTMVLDSDGTPMNVARPPKLPDDAIMGVSWKDGTDFGEYTLEQVDEGAEGIAFSFNPC